MKITIEIKETEDNVWKGKLTYNKAVHHINWTIDERQLPGIQHKGIDKNFLAMYNIGRRLLSDFTRERMYPAGDPMKTPAQRKEEAEKAEDPDVPSEPNE